jgi:hypothetical protein
MSLLGIKHDTFSAKVAASAFRARLSLTSQPKVVALTLELVDQSMQQCPSLHAQVGSKEFMNVLVLMLSNKDGTLPQQVKTQFEIHDNELLDHQQDTITHPEMGHPVCRGHRCSTPVLTGLQCAEAEGFQLPPSCPTVTPSIICLQKCDLL